MRIDTRNSLDTSLQPFDVCLNFEYNGISLLQFSNESFRSPNCPNSRDSVSHLGKIRIEYKLKKTKILRTTSFKWVPSLSWHPVPLNGCRFILYVYLN